MSESDPDISPETDNDNVPDSDSADRKVARFVHEHPAMVIAGGLAIGALAAALVPRRNREYVAEKSSAMADAVSAAGLMLYREALDRADAAGDGIRSIAGKLGGSAGEGADEAKAPNNSAVGGLDIAGSLSALVRHLRGRSQD